MPTLNAAEEQIDHTGEGLAVSHMALLIYKKLNLPTTSHGFFMPPTTGASILDGLLIEKVLKIECCLIVSNPAGSVTTVGVDSTACIGLFLPSLVCHTSMIWLECGRGPCLSSALCCDTFMMSRPARLQSCGSQPSAILSPR